MYHNTHEKILARLAIRLNGMLLNTLGAPQASTTSKTIVLATDQGPVSLRFTVHPHHISHGAKYTMEQMDPKNNNALWRVTVEENNFTGMQKNWRFDNFSGDKDSFQGEPMKWLRQAAVIHDPQTPLELRHDDLQNIVLQIFNQIHDVPLENTATSNVYTEHELYLGEVHPFLPVRATLVLGKDTTVQDALYYTVRISNEQGQKQWEIAHQTEYRTWALRVYHNNKPVPIPKKDFETVLSELNASKILISIQHQFELLRSAHVQHKETLNNHLHYTVQPEM